MNVDEIIASDPMVVFATATCPFCSRAIARLNEEGFEPKVGRAHA